MDKLIRAIIAGALSVLLLPGFPRTGPVRVACVGDSITYGHGISSRSENSYPAKLSSLLGENFLVDNFGDPGSAVQAASDQPYETRELYEESLQFDADIVVFMMGTNDAKPGNWQGEAAFRQDLEGLLDRYAGAKIILCTPAKAFFVKGCEGDVTMFDIQPEVVDTIAEIVRRVAEDREYPLVDIHALTEANPKWFREDGVHPDKKGAAAIAEAVFDTLTP